MEQGNKEKINRDHNFIHPLDKKINGCSHILWAGKPTKISQQPAMLYFMEIKLSIVPPVELVHVHEWHNGIKRKIKKR